MTSILIKEKKMLEMWDLDHLPFYPTPPEDVEYFMKIFTGREREVEQAIQTLYHGQNVLVRGMWGIGKTAFLIGTLENMRIEGESIDKKFYTSIIKDFKGDTCDDLYKAVLLSIADNLANEFDDEDAKDLVNNLVGHKTSRTSSETATAKGGLKIPTLAEVGGQLEEKSEQMDSLDEIDTRHFLNIYIKKALKKYDKLIIAIDDLDKKSPNQVKVMLDEALSMIRDKRISFLMTGRTLSISEDIYSSILGIQTETIILKEFDTDKLKVMARSYMNVARTNNKTDFFPFDEEVIELIATKSLGIARQFMVVAERILFIAIRHEINKIDVASFEKCFSEVQNEVSLKLSPHMRHILYLAKQPSGLSEDISDSKLDELNVKTYIELLPELNELVQKDLLVKLDDGRSTRFEASHLMLSSDLGGYKK